MLFKLNYQLNYLLQEKHLLYTCINIQIAALLLKGNHEKPLKTNFQTVMTVQA